MEILLVNNKRCIALDDIEEAMFEKEYQFGTQTNDKANNWDRLKMDLELWQNVKIDKKDSKNNNK